jgi:hypothetical protein
MKPEDYEQLKNEYKAHYKKLQEIKAKVLQNQHTQRITQALENLDPKPVLTSVEEAIEAVRQKAMLAEAKVELVFSNLNTSTEADEDEVRKQREVELFEQKQAVDSTIADIKEQLNQIKQTKNETSAEKQEDLTATKTAEKQEKSEIKSVFDTETHQKTLGPKKA